MAELVVPFGSGDCIQANGGVAGLRIALFLGQLLGIFAVGLRLCRIERCQSLQRHRNNQLIKIPFRKHTVAALTIA